MSSQSPSAMDAGRMRSVSESPTLRACLLSRPLRRPDLSAVSPEVSLNMPTPLPIQLINQRKVCWKRISIGQRYQGYQLLSVHRLGALVGLRTASQNTCDSRCRRLSVEVLPVRASNRWEVLDAVEWRWGCAPPELSTSTG